MHFLNPANRHRHQHGGLFTGDEYRLVQNFFAGRSELRPTPLLALPSLARSLGVGALEVKDETHRFGLNAFKITGVSYAMERLDTSGSSAVVCATAGNHGRAVARAARERNLRCTVFLPALRTSNPIEDRT